MLKSGGTLIFKWNEHDVKLSEVLELSPIAPLFGHTTGRQAKTIWAAFIKIPSPDSSGLVAGVEPAFLPPPLPESK